MKNAGTADQCKYIHDVGWMSDHGDAGYSVYARLDFYMGPGWLALSRVDDSMPLGRHIIHSLAAHYNLKRLLSVYYNPGAPWFLTSSPLALASGACHLWDCETSVQRAFLREESVGERAGPASFHEPPDELFNSPNGHNRPVTLPSSLSLRH